jgi:hypothetical protein
VILFWILFAIILVFGFVVFRGAPYVPSQKRYLLQALTELYPLGAKDTLVDVGSGDGIVLRMAARLGARAVGYELNPVLVVISRFWSRTQSNVAVHLADFWLSRLPETTTVIYVFMVTRDVKKMIKKMQTEANRIGHPLRVISYGNKLGDKPVDATLGAYFLYTFHPLHSSEAQV